MNMKNAIDHRGPAETPATETSIFAAIRGPLIAGVVVIVGFFGAFAVWGATAPLAGGSIAPGQISPEGSRRVVQHLEGGIVEELHVGDGDSVSAGSPLVTLGDTQAKATYQVWLAQRYHLEAQLARLRAEQSGAEDIDFPEWLRAAAADDREVAVIVSSQQDLFETRRRLNENREEILSRRLGQLEAELQGLRNQIGSQERRLDLTRQEIADTAGLVEQGLAVKPRLLALQREEARVDEGLMANHAAIARAVQAVGETETQLIAMDSDRLDRILSELNEVQNRLSEVNERLLASRDVIERMIVRAPVSGRVVNLRFRSTGGVVKAGEPILEIVPDEERLIIVAKLSPLDIDEVSPGQKASVHLSALPSRNLPRIEAEVLDISPDTLVDEQTQRSYYEVRLIVEPQDLIDLGQRFDLDLTLTPGMPAEVLIITGERTMIDYLLTPLRDSFRRAMRET